MSGGREFAVALGLLWLSGAALRATILAVPPVLPEITAELGLTSVGVGVLTGLPPLLFALGAMPSAALIGRVGAVRTLIGGLLLTAVGAGARGFVGGAGGLDAATAVMCLGVAVMQPAMPSLVRSWAPGRIGFATAVYTNGLLIGELVPVAWVPEVVLPLVGGGWRAVLAGWALPVLATAGLVAAFGRRGEAGLGWGRWAPDFRDGRVWRLGLLLGGVNACYFGLNGFLPGWLGAVGAPEMVRPALTALNLAQIPASVLMLWVAGRLVRRAWAYAGAGGCCWRAWWGAWRCPGRRWRGRGLRGLRGRCC